MAMNWEYLGEDALPPGEISPWTVQTWRSRVPGGWLVLTIREYNSTTALSTTFLPDAEHRWDGNALPAVSWTN